jgi:hypothetical protein
METGFDQGPGGAHRETGPAKGTACFFERTILKGCRSGRETPVAVIQDPFHHQFLIRSDAFAAEDTFAHVPFEKGVEIVEGKGLRHGIQRDETYAQFGGQGAKVTTISFITDNTGFGMVGQEEL